MLLWQYKQPVEIFFHTGFAESLAGFLAERGFRKGLLVCDGFFRQNGLAEQYLAASGGRLVAAFSDIQPNPTLENADKCMEAMAEAGADFALALGGGSAIDCAKLACALSGSGVTTYEAHRNAKPLPARGLPLVAMPTTAGTGSEVTNVSVMTDEQRGIKWSLMGDALYPRVAVIDPSLTLSLPPSVTASTGFDVIAHALEGFWSKNHQPVCDAMALEAARLALLSLPEAYRDGGSLPARSRMCEASVLAGLAFLLPRTAGAHACSYPLTNIYKMPHGEACAFTLAAFARINAAAEGGRLNGFAQKLGFPDAIGMADHLDEMKKTLGLKCSLADASIDKADLPELSRLSRHPLLDNNPVSMNDDDMLAMYQSLA